MTEGQGPEKESQDQKRERSLKDLKKGRKKYQNLGRGQRLDHVLQKNLQDLVHTKNLLEDQNPKSIEDQDQLKGTDLLHGSKTMQAGSQGQMTEDIDPGLGLLAEDVY